MRLRSKGRLRRKSRIRRTLLGTAVRPRLSVYKSLKHIYAQIIDDVNRKTLASASSMDKEIKGTVKKGLDGSRRVGEALAKRARQKGVESVVFDRNGFKFHGRLKALADAARGGGLKF